MATETFRSEKTRVEPKSGRLCELYKIHKIEEGYAYYDDVRGCSLLKSMGNPGGSPFVVDGFIAMPHDSLTVSWYVSPSEAMQYLAPAE